MADKYTVIGMGVPQRDQDLEIAENVRGWHWTRTDNVPVDGNDETWLVPPDINFGMVRFNRKVWLSLFPLGRISFDRRIYVLSIPESFPDYSLE